MMRQRPIEVLFTGHAPVHYACFRPLGDKLRNMPGVNVTVSGGFKNKSEDEVSYDTQGMYSLFDTSDDEVKSVEEIKERDFDVVFAANTKFLAPRHAEATVQIFHGISFRNKAVREANMGCDYYFLAGPYMKRRFVDADLMTDDDPRALSIGFLKTDRLVDGSLDRDELLERFGLSGSRPILLYAPTGQKHNSLEIMGEQALRNLSATDSFDVILKPHDHAKDTSVDWTERIRSLGLPGVSVIEEPDVIPLLFLADLLITDASSVSSEYSLLNRPMVFLDVPDLLRKARKKDGAVDDETWGRRAGVLVQTPDEVVGAVESSLSQPERYSDTRQAMAHDLFFNPGRATDCAMEWFQKRFALQP